MRAAVYLAIAREDEDPADAVKFAAGTRSEVEEWFLNNELPPEEYRVEEWSIEVPQ